MNTGFTISGISDVNEVLATIAPREAINLMRVTVHDIAGQAVKIAQGYSPDDTGVLDKSMRHKRARSKKGTVQSDVIVAGEAYYWRFLEYGQGPDRVEHAMFLKTLQAMRPDLDRIYLDTFVRKLEARLARARKKQGG